MTELIQTANQVTWPGAVVVVACILGLCFIAWLLAR